MSLLFESQSGPRSKKLTESQLDARLGSLNGGDESFASLSAANGSYIQVGGGPDAFTVEVRETRSDGSFRHWKADRKDGLDAEQLLSIGGNDVAVKASQVVDMETVQRLFRFFALNQLRDPSFPWTDMTSMFAD